MIFFRSFLVVGILSPLVASSDQPQAVLRSSREQAERKLTISTIPDTVTVEDICDFAEAVLPAPFTVSGVPDVTYAFSGNGITFTFTTCGALPLIGIFTEVGAGGTELGDGDGVTKITGGTSLGCTAGAEHETLIFTPMDDETYFLIALESTGTGSVNIDWGANGLACPNLCVVSESPTLFPTAAPTTSPTSFPTTSPTTSPSTSAPTESSCVENPTCEWVLDDMDMPIPSASVVCIQEEGKDPKSDCIDNERIDGVAIGDFIMTKSMKKESDFVLVSCGCCSTDQGDDFCGTPCPVDGEVCGDTKSGKAKVNVCVLGKGGDVKDSCKDPFYELDVGESCGTCPP